MSWSMGGRSVLFPVVLLFIAAVLATGGCASKPPTVETHAMDQQLARVPDSVAELRGAASLRMRRTLEAPEQEFRGVFVATAYNLDWPYKPNLHYTEMHQQMEAIIKRAKAMNANVIMLQVRSMGDRIYRRNTASPNIPWAEALVGGKPNQREIDPVNASYDPLEEWIRACHREGLEIHAWFNPFRVDTLLEDGNAKCYPLIETTDGKRAWLNPSKASVQEHVRKVLADLLAYRTLPTTPFPSNNPITLSTHGAMLASDDGLDGVIIDHDLPPPDPDDPTKDPGTTQPTTRQTLGNPGIGGLALLTTSMLAPAPVATRGGWLVKEANKRLISPDTNASYNAFMGEIYTTVSTAGLAFGLSPTLNNSQAKDWARRGWCDYLIPEIYIKRGTGQFKNALNPWLALKRTSDNTHPVVIAGLFTARTHIPPPGTDDLWSASEIKGQVGEARSHAHLGRKANGQAHFSASALREEAHAGPPGADNIGDELRDHNNNDDGYTEPAVVPVLKPGTHVAPDAPTVHAIAGGYVTWTPATTGPEVKRWAVRFEHPTDGWSDNKILPAHETTVEVPAGHTKAAVYAIGKQNQVSVAGLSP